jgi:hypothetical protein
LQNENGPRIGRVENRGMRLIVTFFGVLALLALVIPVH